MSLMSFDSEEGCRVEKEIKWMDRLHGMMSQRKAAFNNKCMHMRVNTWGEKMTLTGYSAQVAEI